MSLTAVPTDGGGLCRTSPRQVLLVEANPADAAQVARVLEQEREWRLVRFDNCRSALTHLCQGSLEKPLLILLAWDIPGASEFLAAVKADDRLRAIPLVILSASSELRGVSTGFALGAAGYLVKSRDPTRLGEDLAALRAYWALSELPRP